MSVFGYVHVRTGAHGGQSHYIHLELQLQAFVILTWVCCWVSNLGPRQEQCILLTPEPPLDSP